MQKQRFDHEWRFHLGDFPEQRLLLLCVVDRFKLSKKQGSIPMKNFRQEKSSLI
jgi:hypothetical protein